MGPRTKTTTPGMPIEDGTIRPHRSKSRWRVLAALASVFTVMTALPAVPALAVSSYGLSSGTVKTAAGQSVAGARVDLYFDKPVTAQTTLTPFSSGTTDASGSYNLSTSNTQPIANAGLGNDGWANVMQVATDDTGKISAFFYSIGLNPIGNVIRRGDPDMTGLTEMGAILDSANFNMVLGGSNPDVGCGGGIVKVPVGNPFKNWTTIGDLHGASDIRDMTFSYGQTADSDISVGFAVGTTGAWGVNGSRHVGTTKSGYAGTTETVDNWAHLYRTNFQYQQYKFVGCLGHVQYRTVEAQVWIPSTNIGLDVSYLDHHCVPSALYTSEFAANGFFGRSNNDYVTFNAGATITIGAASFDLRSQSGLSNNVQVDWHFGSGQNHHYLCPSNADNRPIQQSRRILAGS